MNPYRPRLVHTQSGPRTWLQRLALAVVAAGLFVIAFFFVTLALAAGAVLAMVVAVRWWWLTRKLRSAQEARAPLEGEYRVVERSEARER